MVIDDEIMDGVRLFYLKTPKDRERERPHMGDFGFEKRQKKLQSCLLNNFKNIYCSVLNNNDDFTYSNSKQSVSCRLYI